MIRLVGSIQRNLLCGIFVSFECFLSRDLLKKVQNIWYFENELCMEILEMEHKFQPLKLVTGLCKCQDWGQN